MITNYCIYSKCIGFFLAKTHKVCSAQRRDMGEDHHHRHQLPKALVDKISDMWSITDKAKSGLLNVRMRRCKSYAIVVTSHAVASNNC